MSGVAFTLGDVMDGNMGITGKIWDVVIIGSGPAGLTAAIYTSRARLDTLVIAGYSWGGQLMTATLVENFPGFPDGIRGPELMDRIRRQAERFGAKLVYRDVTSVDFRVTPYLIYVDDLVIRARTVIIATGARYRRLGLKSEEKLMGRGVSYCAVCDGYFFRDKRVAVIGGGDVALMDALFLATLAREVYIIHRRDKFRAEMYLQERVRENPKIKTMMGYIVRDIIGEDRVEGLILLNLKSNEEVKFECDGVFIAVGHEPASELFKDQLELTESGHIRVSDFVKTNIPGVFAAGDVVDPKYRQAITAAAMGAMAAMEVESYLRRE